MKNFQKLIVDSFAIFKSVKWDYAKMAQLVKLWGGPKKAAIFFVTFFTTIGAVAGPTFQKLFKSFLAKLSPSKSKSTTIDNEKNILIQQKTEEYLLKVQERRNNNLDTDDIDKEYNDYIKSLLDEDDQ